jgi:hypothetical protein
MDISQNKIVNVSGYKTDKALVGMQPNRHAPQLLNGYLQ